MLGKVGIDLEKTQVLAQYKRISDAMDRHGYELSR